MLDVVLTVKLIMPNVEVLYWNPWWQDHNSAMQKIQPCSSPPPPPT